MTLLQSIVRHLAAPLLVVALLASGQSMAQAQKSAASKPAAGEPVLVGVDAEFSDATSTSDDAIRLGIRLAIEEINAAGGVLGGRPLKLVERDNRSVPARGVANAKEFAGMTDLVAFFCGKFSPVAMDHAKVANESGLVMLDPWAAADKIVDNGANPNYVFRLSLRDSIAVSALLKNARARNLLRVGVLAPNSGWGRSSLAAAEAYAATTGDRMKIVATQWYNWGGEKSLRDRYAALRTAGAQVLLLVANEPEGATLMREMGELPETERMPVVSHWGITGGDFVSLSAGALSKIDLAVVQTFSLAEGKSPAARRATEEAMKLFNVDHPAKIYSGAGVIHAYDLTRMLALAINRAGSTDRAAIRAAMEKLRNVDGMVRRYAQPFTETRHEALEEGDLFLARYTTDGRLLRIGSAH
jgi:branched-chain amino acid transport system substrate-binding protein